jgi:creatinine amidohydrolase
MKLEELTSPEVAELSRDVVVVVPVASVEQHSLHLPVYTDSMILEEVVRRLDRRMPDDVLILPVMWLGYSQHHMKYPGTISAGSETHAALMMDIVSSVVDHGFKRVLIVNSHGGNEANIQVLLQRLMEKYEYAEIFACTSYSGPGSEKIAEIQEEGPDGSGHAGETETSMILCLRPDLVKTDRLDADGQHARLELEGVRNYRRMDQRTSHGGVGDPRTATAEKGEQFFEASVEGLAEVVREIRAGALPDPG